MHTLTIKNLGPIKNCTLNVSDFTVLTGYQSSGKSTIAKSIFFFRTLKDDLEDIVLKREMLETESLVSIGEQFRQTILEKLVRTFGVGALNNRGSIKYSYSKSVWISVSLGNQTNVRFSSRLEKFLNNDILEIPLWKSPENEQANVRPEDNAVESFRKYAFAVNLHRALKDCFSDEYQTVYIPAGRSMLTLLSSQWNYLYASMDDNQKSLFDSCTQDYIERVMKIKSQIEAGLFDRKMRNFIAHASISGSYISKINLAKSLMNNILKGSYVCRNGKESLLLLNGKQVDINYSSSGQQESVWVLNILYYYLLNQTKIFFIIEEPESNLFPESQKYISEMIALIVGEGHSAMVTTHSPYVLGTLNNLLYAGSASNTNIELETKIAGIIPKDYWIDSQRFAAYFVEEGTARDGIDREIQQIDSDKLDAISHVVNEEYDNMADLFFESRQDGE